MTRDEVCAAAPRVIRYHKRFKNLFGRREAQEHSFLYLKGLMSDQECKSVEPMALRFARSPGGGPAMQNEVVAMQGFITDSPWEAGDVFTEIQAVFAGEFVPTTQQWPIGTVGVIDESGYVKAGSQSVGVARQWCGRLGKAANCQVGVFLVGVTPGGTASGRAVVPHRGVDSGPTAAKKTRVPRGVKFQSKPQIAAEMIRRALATGKVHFDWITADEPLRRQW